MSELPEGWTASSLEELLTSLESGSRPRGGVRGIKEGVPSIGGEHLTYAGTFDFTSIKYVPEAFAANMAQGQVQNSDILIVKDGATTGKTAFVSSDFPYSNAVVNEHVFVCRPTKQIEPRFLFRYLTSKEGQGRILENFQGSAQGGINRAFAPNTEIPLAPLNEQRRIVAKLDKLLSRVDAAQARLATIPCVLERFRQSVLAAACSGRLTTDWRSSQSVLETASQLIDKVGELRRHRYNETCRLAEYRGKYKPRDYDNYAPFVRTDLDRFDLPDEWAWVDLRFLMDEQEPFCYGVVQPSIDDPNGIFLVRAGDLQEGSVNMQELRKIPVEVDKEYSRSKLKGGELLVTVVGANIGTVSIAPDECKGFNIARAVAKIPIEDFSTRYIFYWLNTSKALSWMMGDAREVARPTLNLEQLRTILVPLPPLAEQQEIVRRVEALFKTADALEARYRKARGHVDKLAQSILARAFRGELVITEAELARQEVRDYEPASALLEHIRQERARQQQESTKSKPKRQPRSKKDTATKEMFA